MVPKGKKKVILISICVIIIFLGFVILYTQLSPGTIYFDNGYNQPFDVYIDGENKGVIKAGSLLIIKQIAGGNHLIEIKENGDVFETESVDVRGIKYIYNIGGKNSYLVVTYQFTSSGQAPGHTGARKLGNNKFFAKPQTDFDLGQEVPERIKTKEPVAIIRRTSLQREK